MPRQQEICQLCGLRAVKKADTEDSHKYQLAYLGLTCSECRQKEKNRIHSNNTGKRMRRKGRKGQRGNVRYVDWMQLLSAHKFSCRFCGKKGREHLTIDHIRSMDLGGMNTIDNVQPLCQSCHTTKDATRPSRFRWLKDPYRRFRFWVKKTIRINLPYPSFFKGK